MTLQSDVLPAISPSKYRSGYRAAVFALLVLLAFSTLPSPLYGIYAARDGFSSLMITVVYAAYAIGVMVSLFFAGHLSDSYGRRPVLLAALALDACSAVIFLVWPSLAGLLVARVVCGLSVGVTSSTATAYLTELYATHRPPGLLHRAQIMAAAVTLGGFAVGAGAAGVLAQYAGHALTLPYIVWLAGFALAAVGIARAPETRHRAASLPAYRPQRVSVPQHARARFFAALLGAALVLATLGMFVGLAGTFLATTLHRTSLALSGGTIVLVFGVGVAMIVATGSWPVRRLLGTGIALMVAGLAALTVAAWLPTPSLALFLVGGAIIGGGGATGFRGTLGTVAEISGRDKLAEALAGYFLAGYLGLSVPVIGLGLALQSVSTRGALLGFAVVIAAALLAAAPVLLRRD